MNRKVDPVELRKLAAIIVKEAIVKVNHRKLLDLGKLNPEKRERVERALSARDTTF